MKQKKLVPKRRFECLTDEWNSKKMKELASFSKGRDYSKRDLVSYGNPIILYGHLYTNYQSYIQSVKTYAIRKENSVISQGNEVIVPSSGETAEDIVRASAVAISGIILAGDLNIIKPNSILDSLFLGLNISNGSVNKELIKRVQGSSVVHLYNSDIEEVNLSYPSVTEQKKIGNFFKHLDQMISFEQRKLEKTKALKSAYLAEMFPAEGERVPKRRFTDFKKDWQETLLGELGNTFSGMSGKTKKDFGHGDAEFVTYMNVFKNEISDTSLTEKVVLDNKQTEVKYGDVLFTTSSETAHEVGMSSIWLDNRPNVYLNSFCFGFRPTLKMNKLYLAYLLRSNEIRSQIEVLAQGISRYNISKVRVMEITIYIPDHEEQQAIGEFFKKLDDSIANQQQKLNKFKAMKQAYLEEMFV